MKKSLLALAALGAFAGTAHAQSSVTVYGILDVGYLSTNGTFGGTAVAGTAAVAATATEPAIASTAGRPNGAKRITSGFNTGMLSTSRLGFRGVEDLGGGMSASFVAEMGLTPTGNGFSGSTNFNSSPMGSGYVHNAGGVDSRQMFAGLGSKGLGEIRIGRQNTPVHEAICATNAGQCNALVGDLINQSANSSATQTVANGLAVSHQVRASNSITARTENINGFQATALLSVNNNFVENPNNVAINTQAGQGATNYRMWGLNGSFTGIKNLDARVAHQVTGLNRDNIAATANSQIVIGSALFDIAPAATQGIARREQTDQYANLSYNFGVAKVALQTSVLKVEDSGIQALKRTANQLAVNVPVSGAIGVWASYGVGKYQLLTSGRNTAFTGMQLGTTYNLSKRTNLYGIYGQVKQDALNQTAGQVDYKDQQYAVGIRHSF
jgi:predicted porin